MKVTRHGPNLWQLTRLFAFNAYFVQQDDGLTLVDTNMAGSGRAILRAAQALGRPITRIVLTHAHADHAGSLDELAARLPGVEVAYSRRTADFLSGDLTLRPGEPEAEVRGGFAPRVTPAARFLRPGDTLGALRVIAAPGHSPDQIAFFDERDGTLIAGDAFQTQAGIAVSGIRRRLFPFPAMATWHLPTALETARALHALNPTRLAVGHGAVLEAPREPMAAAILEAETTLHDHAPVAQS